MEKELLDGLHVANPIENNAFGDMLEKTISVCHELKETLPRLLGRTICGAAIPSHIA
jgi:hypothetical protein